MINVVAAVAIIIGFLVIVLMTAGVRPSEVTFTQIAADKARSCVSSNGQLGVVDWRASSGMTLEQFCKTYGAIHAYDRFCDQNPDKC